MKKCEHPNPRHNVDAAGNFSIYCPDCKKSVTEAQSMLVLAWWKKLEKIKEAARG